MKVGQIGLGALGSIFAGHLRQAGVELRVYDLSGERVEAAKKLGAKSASSPAEVARGADYLLVSLPDPAAGRAALLGATGAIAALTPGSVVLDLSTIDPETAIANETAAKAVGVHYVEAPISGGEPMSAGTDGARNRNVTFMAGGEKTAFEAALPLMSLLGKHPLHLGSVGTGAKVKLISNYIAG